MITQLALPLTAAAMMLGTASCATRPEAAPRAPRPVVRAAPEGAEYPIIVRLVGRHYDITCSSSPAGPVYTAATHDGKLIVANATLAELRNEHPEIYEQIIPTIAEHADERSGRGSRPIESDASAEPTSIGIMSAR
jgi:hypothetical protein